MADNAFEQEYSENLVSGLQKILMYVSPKKSDR